VTPRNYPADPAEAALRLFLRWFGGHYARSVTAELLPRAEDDEGPLFASLTVGRQWQLHAAVLDTLAPEATLPYEAARAAIEERLDSDVRLPGATLLWAPRGALLPADGPTLSQLIDAVAAAQPLEDGRLEVRRPVRLYLRRTSTTGSVITILGGLAAHWAQFTNRVPGSFQINSTELYRLPQSEEEREALRERIVMAAGQPDVDDGIVLGTDDVWTANQLDDGRSCVIGSPFAESDEQASGLRKTLRSGLRAAAAQVDRSAAARALVVLGASTYAAEERLSLLLRGIDPAQYAGYEIIVVVADGVVKRVMTPGRNVLPWDV
jgi:hypothetical protein